MSVKSMLKMSVIAASLLSGFSFAASHTDTLAKLRPLMKFNELNSVEKQVLAEQSQLVLRDLYVNRYEKNRFYGTSPTFDRHKDPAAEIDAIRANIHKISTTDLHRNLSRIFVNQRDLHLNYNLPAPYSAFITFLPFNFTRTVASNGANEVRINTTYPYYFRNFYPDQRIPQVGDLVLEYDNLPIEAAVQKNIAYGNGANNHAGYARALEIMTFTWQGQMLAPEKDQVTLKLKSASNGEVYSITIPWVANYWDEDLAPQSTSSANANNQREKRAALSNETYQEKFNKFVAENQEIKDFGIAKNATAESSVKWSIVNKGDKKIGYLSLSSFSPSNVTYWRALNIIGDLLRNQLASTDALIIDVRNNGGGYISYADMLPTMFIPGDALPSAARLLNTKTNAEFLQSSYFLELEPEWAKVMADVAGTSNRYSKTEIFTSLPVTNYLGQRYYKPVGVLMNAKTYSAGDLFTCQMQDNGAATIFGEDPSSGAGGANVWEHSYFVDIAPHMFKPLPGGVSMRVSWRQSVRSGYNAGAIIEDHGCKASVQVPRVFSDMKNGDLTQFDKIATQLLAKPLPNGRVQFPSSSDTVNVSASAKTLTIGVANTEYVKVYVNNVLFKTKRVGIYGPLKNLDVELPVAQVGQRYRIAIVGTDTAQKPIWNTKRTISLVN